MLIEVAVMTNPEPVSSTTGADMITKGGSTNNVADSALYAIIANVVNLERALIVLMIKARTDTIFNYNYGSFLDFSLSVFIIVSFFILLYFSLSVSRLLLSDCSSSALACSTLGSVSSSYLSGRGCA
jgi:hypothetical protein